MTVLTGELISEFVYLLIYGARVYSTQSTLKSPESGEHIKILSKESQLAKGQKINFSVFSEKEKLSSSNSVGPTKPAREDKQKRESR